MAVITASAILGMFLAVSPELGDLLPESETSVNTSEGPVYGSAHEHALFYVVVNGTELDFSGEKFQLNSRYVHLENGRSHIVHKHAEGVTWKMFLETINTSIRETNESRYCINIYNQSHCGSGEIYVGGGDLNSTIDQDEKLILVLGENASEVISEYRGRKLPRDYRPRKPGQGV